MIVFMCLFFSSVFSGSVGVEEETVFSNSWAVEVKGGRHVADRLAEKHGFINKGLVRKTPSESLTLSLWYSFDHDINIFQVGSLEDVYHFVHRESPSRVSRSLSSLHPKHHDLVAEEQVRKLLVIWSSTVLNHGCSLHAIYSATEQDIKIVTADLTCMYPVSLGTQLGQLMDYLHPQWQAEFTFLRASVCKNVRKLLIITLGTLSQHSIIVKEMTRTGLTFG